MGNNKNKHKHFNFNKKPQKQVDNYTPKGKKEDLDRKIEDLKLSKHCYDALKAGGINIVRQLCMYRASKMYRIQNIGKKDCVEIANKLKQFNLAFRPEEEIVVQNIPQNKNNQQNKKFNNANQIKVTFSIFNDKQLVQFLEGERQREIYKWDDDQPVRRDIIKFCRNGKWGYKDAKGNQIIAPAFDEAFNFSEDLACVEKDSKLGYINKQGEIVIDYTYDSASSFSDGLACVTKDDMTGYIDKEGKIVFDLKFEKATPFKEGKALIKQDGKWGILQKTGDIYWR